MQRLFLATRNAHKTREVAEMLGAKFVLEDLRGRPEINEVIEDGATLVENARLKPGRSRGKSRGWCWRTIRDWRSIR